MVACIPGLTLFPSCCGYFAASDGSLRYSTFPASDHSLVGSTPGSRCAGIVWCVVWGVARLLDVNTAVLSADTVRQALRQVKDPELDMNIVDLGLVYDVEVDGGLVRINMTLTSPGCPAGPMITNDIYKAVRALEGVSDVDIDIVWEPYWTPERIDPKIRAMMGF